MKKALGKGLHSLIPRSNKEDKSEVLDALDQHAIIHEININEITPQKNQPRQFFDESKLNELKASIEEQGLIQPIIVKKNANGKYDLIAGERRYRAVKALGKVNIPAIVKDVSDEKMLELAIIENIQREDLNPIEEAESYQRLLTKYNLTQEIVAKKVGKDRVTISNTIRLLKLPDIVKQMVYNSEISPGHGRALLALEHIEQQLAFAKEITKKGLSVRQTENMIKTLANKNKKDYNNSTSNNTQSIDPELSELENNLKKFFGTKVKIDSKGKRGTIKIDYFSYEDLNRILEVLGYNS